MSELNVTCLRRAKISEQIFEYLREQISNGTWKPGEQIPTENELAAAFGVSRMSARSGIQRLSALGLVDVRVGEGTFVKKYDPGETFSEVSRLLYSPDILKDLRDFRLDFDSIVMERACRVRSENDIDSLKKIYDEMRVAADSGDLESFNEADLRFHECLIDITGNSVYRVVGSMIRELMKVHYEDSTQHFEKEFPDSGESNINYLQGLYEEHGYYLKSLEKRDKSLIAERLERHFEHYSAGPQNNR